MKVYGGVDADPCILDLGTSWRWVVIFIPWPLYLQRKIPQYPLDRRLAGPRNRSGWPGEENLPTRTWTSTPQQSSSWPVAIPTALTHFPYIHLNVVFPSLLLVFQGDCSREVPQPKILDTFIICPILPTCPVLFLWLLISALQCWLERWVNNALKDFRRNQLWKNLDWTVGVPADIWIQHHEYKSRALLLHQPARLSNLSQPSKVHHPNTV
jgi:hypothetical protein